VKIQDYFSRRTDLPVVVDNDATAAAIGESWFGTGRAVGKNPVGLCVPLLG
jgi:predicted NBD/HSP70 family sugar kinase